MRRHIANEKGNASIYLLWFIFICGFFLVFVFNIMNLYAKKEQAAIGAEQASFALTDVILDAVREGVDDYDRSLPGIAHAALQNGKSVTDRIEEAASDYEWQGSDRMQAVIKAYNDVLGDELRENFELKSSILSELYRVESEIRQVAAQQILSNNGKTDGARVELFQDGRIAVTSHAEYETKVFDAMIPYMKKDVPYRGFGPKLEFVNQLGWGGMTIYL